MQQFASTHKLDFEIAPWITMEFELFRIGTCEGLYGATETTYDILVITNSEPGNGHLNDVFEWFENSCRRDGKALRVLEVWNQAFKSNLISTRGFVVEGEDHLIKHFNGLKQ